MDDFVINVRQIWQYPLLSGLNGGEVLLVQQQPGAGAYNSITAVDFVRTVMDGGGLMQFAADSTSGIAFNGALITSDGSSFSFSVPINVSAVNIAGLPAATVDYVNAQIAGINSGLSQLVNNIVEALKSQPFVLALLLVNAIFLMVLAFVLQEVSQSIERRDAIIEQCMKGHL